MASCSCGGWVLCVCVCYVCVCVSMGRGFEGLDESVLFCMHCVHPPTLHLGAVGEQVQAVVVPEHHLVARLHLDVCV
jgi:hypothetical protein